MLDDTLVYYIIGDNAASAEGTPNGSHDHLITPQDRLRAAMVRQ